MTDKRNPGGDATGLIQSLSASDGSSLLAAANLGRLIRQFIAEVLDAVSRASEGQITRELGIATVQAGCRRFARVMTGAAPSEFSIDGKWFPAGVARHLRVELETTGSDEDVLAEAWASVANHAFEIAKLPDEAGQQQAADDLVRATLMLFSGLK